MFSTTPQLPPSLTGSRWARDRETAIGRWSQCLESGWQRSRDVLVTHCCVMALLGSSRMCEHYDLPQETTYMILSHREEVAHSCLRREGKTSLLTWAACVLVLYSFRSFVHVTFIVPNTSMLIGWSILHLHAIAKQLKVYHTSVLLI